MHQFYWRYLTVFWTPCSMSWAEFNHARQWANKRFTVWYYYHHVFAHWNPNCNCLLLSLNVIDHKNCLKEALNYYFVDIFICFWEKPWILTGCVTKYNSTTGAVFKYRQRGGKEIENWSHPGVITVVLQCYYQWLPVIHK